MIRELSKEEIKHYQDELENGNRSIGIYSSFGCIFGDARLILIETKDKVYLASRGEFVISGFVVGFKNDYLPIVQEIIKLLKEDTEKYFHEE